MPKGFNKLPCTKMAAWNYKRAISEKGKRELAMLMILDIFPIRRVALGEQIFIYCQD